MGGWLGPRAILRVRRLIRCGVGLIRVRIRLLRGRIRYVPLGTHAGGVLTLPSDSVCVVHPPGDRLLELSATRSVAVFLGLLKAVIAVANQEAGMLSRDISKK